jgi:hypothetical protein
VTETVRRAERFGARTPAPTVDMQKVPLPST